MMENSAILLSGAIVLGAGVIVGTLYAVIRRMRTHAKDHRPEVANKISDFYSTQDTTYTN